MINYTFKSILVLTICLAFSACNSNQSSPDPSPILPDKSEAPSTEKPVASEPAAIFKRLNCQGCHMAENSIVGPSLVQIRENYQGDKDALNLFLKGELEPRIDQENYLKMKPSIEAYKALTIEEQQRLLDFLLSE